MTKEPLTLSNMKEIKVKSIKPYTIFICDDCIALKGEMCNEPACCFCRRTMKEVGELLDILLIRPIIDGKRIEGVLR